MNDGYTEDDNEGAKDEIEKDLGIEPGSDEEAQIDDIFDTDYDLVWDSLDDDEQEEYIKVAKSIRRLKPDEAFIDVKQEIDDKAKKNHLKADILTYAYLDIITKKTESKMLHDAIIRVMQKDSGQTYTFNNAIIYNIIVDWFVILETV